MTHGRDVVVVAASAGGLQPLRAMLAALPADLPAAVLVVLHVPASGGRALPRILDRAGPLIAASAVDGEPLRNGHVYVAPPDRHLLVVENTVRLSHRPRQNGVRPAADPLFRSAALHAGPRTTAVVLSGTLDDAALGSATVERRGGRVLVQDPGEADYDSMPRSAIAATSNPVVLPAANLGIRIGGLAAGTRGPESRDGQRRPAAIEAADAVLDAELAAEITGLLAGNPEPSSADSSFSDGSQTIDCLTGDNWSPRAQPEDRPASVERALWLAVRALEERGSLAGRLSAAARQRGHPLTAEQFGSVEVEARQAAQAIREVASVLITEVRQQSADGVAAGSKADGQVAVRSTRA
jgi:two-component system chemotaxis response regulator CheB